MMKQISVEDYHDTPRCAPPELTLVPNTHGPEPRGIMIEWSHVSDPTEIYTCTFRPFARRPIEGPEDTISHRLFLEPKVSGQSLATGMHTTHTPTNHG